MSLKISNRIAHHNDALWPLWTVMAAATRARGAAAAKKPAKAILVISSGSCQRVAYQRQKTIEPDRKTIDMVASTEIR